MHGNYYNSYEQRPKPLVFVYLLIVIVLASLIVYTCTDLLNKRIEQEAQDVIEVNCKSDSTAYYQTFVIRDDKIELPTTMFDDGDTVYVFMIRSDLVDIR